MAFALYYKSVLNNLDPRENPRLLSAYNRTNLNFKHLQNDVRFNEPQLEFIHNHYFIGEKKRRRKRKTVNFDTAPSRMWTMPIKYKIHPSGFSGRIVTIVIMKR